MGDEGCTIVPICSAWYHLADLLNISCRFKLLNSDFPPCISFFSSLDARKYSSFPHCMTSPHIFSIIYIMSLLVATLHWNYMTLALKELLKPPCSHGCTITSVGNVQGVMWFCTHSSCYTHFPQFPTRFISLESLRPRLKVETFFWGFEQCLAVQHAFVTMVQVERSFAQPHLHTLCFS